MPFLTQAPSTFLSKGYDLILWKNILEGLAYAAKLLLICDLKMTLRTNGTQREIKVKGQKLETVTSFKYLGSE